MKNWCKDNAVVLAGIALPIVIAIGFFTATQIQRAAIPPPKYAVLIEAGRPYQTPYSFVISDNRLVLRYVPPSKEEHQDNQRSRLFLFNPKDNSVREISVPPLTEEQQKIFTTLPIEDLKNVRVSSDSLKSPDGYILDTEYRGSGNFVGEMFGSGSDRRYRASLNKGAQKVAVPIPYREGNYHYHTHFIAWIIPENEGAK